MSKSLPGITIHAAVSAIWVPSGPPPWLWWWVAGRGVEPLAPYHAPQVPEIDQDDYFHPRPTRSSNVWPRMGENTKRKQNLQCCLAWHWPGEHQVHPCWFWMILAELLNNLNSIRSMPSFRDQRRPVPAQLGPATLGWAMAHVSDEMTSNAGLSTWRPSSQ